LAKSTNCISPQNATFSSLLSLATKYLPQHILQQPQPVLFFSHDSNSNSSFSTTDPSISLLAMLSGRWGTGATEVSKYMMTKIIYSLPHKLGTAIIWWRRETGRDNWKNAVWIHM